MANQTYNAQRANWWHAVCGRLWMMGAQLTLCTWGPDVLSRCSPSRRKRWTSRCGTRQAWYGTGPAWYGTGPGMALRWTSRCGTRHVRRSNRYHVMSFVRCTLHQCRRDCGGISAGQTTTRRHVHAREHAHTHAGGTWLSGSAPGLAAQGVVRRCLALGRK